MSKPTLGYPSRSEAFLALKEQGLTHGEIARRCGVTASAVAGVLHAKRREVGPVPRKVPAPRKVPDRALSVDPFFIDEATRKSLRPHARRRSLSVNGLLDRLIEKIVSDRLVDAVLDDGDEL